MAAASTKKLEDSMELLLSAVQAMQQTLGTIDGRVSSVEAANAAIASRCERIEGAQGTLGLRCDGIEATLKLLAERPRHKSRRHLDGIGDVSKDSPPVRDVRRGHSRRGDPAALEAAAGVSA